jgi:hypothetical protein
MNWFALRFLGMITGVGMKGGMVDMMEILATF